jgi:hypothetical protein
MSVFLRQVIGEACATVATPRRYLPINSSISVIWKHETRATSHAAWGMFPITPGYRKLEGVDNR